MKFIAFYLPQFHQIPENDRWWGEGFTEWTNVRKATPLFKGHYQPREPLDNNYYDLLDPDTVKWQAKIAREYGIYGFCYYHYWFQGKKLLEKPLERMLISGEPDIPFCLSWANEPWTRRWEGGSNKVLMPQNYGSEEDWKNHFKYLLKYFLDRRYIKIDGKPVFLIYRTSSIPNADEVIGYWKHRAKESGLKGLFIIETLNSFQNKPFSSQSHGILEFEPMYTISYGKSSLFKILHKSKKLLNILSRKDIMGPSVFDYDIVWNYILSRKNIRFNNKQLFLSAFPDWDNSPRRKGNGTLFKGSSPEKFERYLKMQIKKAKNYNNSEFIFINAWNEWAESAYLEPDKKWGYGYLEAVKNVLDSLK